MLTKGHYNFKEHTLDVIMQGLFALPSESEYTIHTHCFINLSVFFLYRCTVHFIESYN